MESILTSIKKLLGITPEYTHFDPDLVIHINSVFMILTQIGVGPSEGFSIANEYSTWDEFLTNGINLELVKTYVYLKVKLLFDPPQGSAHMEAINRSIAEYEWRLSVAIESAQAREE